MRIGEKIKKLRTEKSMTQSELAGGFITRNMLSLIESGSAQPSLTTIEYIAKRLNVPTGILVSDDDDEYFYRRTALVQNIRRAYAAGDHRICLDLCDKLSDDVDDDELLLIRSECYLGVAKEEFLKGQLKSAVSTFDKSCETASKTVYNTSHIESEAKVYCLYMRSLSPLLYADCVDSQIHLGLSESDPFCRYARAAMSIDEQGSSNAIADDYLSLKVDNDVYTDHIRALYCMINNDHQKALNIISELINGKRTVPSPLMYTLFRDLEICCRETGDFKGAYEYAGAKVVTLERLLLEN